MNDFNNVGRQQVLTLALTARTSEQLAAATCELNAWIAEHPDDTGIEWANEQMALVRTALPETTSPYQKDMEAEQQVLVALAIAAKTPAEIEHATQALDDWLRHALKDDDVLLVAPAHHQSVAA